MTQSKGENLTKTNLNHKKHKNEILIPFSQTYVIFNPAYQQAEIDKSYEGSVGNPEANSHDF